MGLGLGSGLGLGFGLGLGLGLGSGLVMSLLSRAWARRLAVGPEAGEEAVQRRALTHEAGEARLLRGLEQHLVSSAIVGSERP